MNLVRNHDDVMFGVARPQAVDELGGLLRRYNVVVVRLHEQHGRVPLVDGRDGGGFHRPAVRIASLDWVAYGGQKRRPVMYARIIDTGRECIRGARETEGCHESPIAWPPNAQSMDVDVLSASEIGDSAEQVIDLAAAAGAEVFRLSVVKAIAGA